MKRFTYFAHCGKTGLTKIGKSSNPRARVKQLRPIPALFAIVPDEHLSESEAHHIFSSCRCIGEWFNLDKEAVVTFLKLKEIPFIAGDKIEGLRPHRQEGKPINGKHTVSFKIEEDAYRLLSELAEQEGRSMASQSLVLVLEWLGLREPKRRKATTA